MSEAVRGPAAKPPGLGGGAGHLVIVDRADRWPAGDLLDLIGDVRLHSRTATRYLLLSRSAGGWWRTVSAHVERRVGLTATQSRLEPLAVRAAERELLFLQAFGRFADVADAPQPPEEIRIPDGLDGLESALDIQRAALAAVDPGSKADTDEQSFQDLSFEDLVDAAARSPELAVIALLPQLSRQPDLVRSATGATLVTLAGVPALPIELLQTLDTALGESEGIDFEAGRAQLARRVIGELLRRTRDSAERAALYDRLGDRLLHPGHQQDALDAYAHAVDLRRTVARRDPVPVRRGELAMSLGRLGVAQAELRRWAGALSSLQEALRGWIHLRREGYFAFDLAVARCYGTLSTVFDGIGSDREAFAARQYATRIFRTLKANGVIGDDEVATSLSDLGERYLRRGYFLDAAHRSSEVVPLLPPGDPRLAAVRLLRGRALWQAGRLAEAGSELQQAVEAYRDLGDEKVQHIGPLAEALTYLAHVRRATNPVAALALYEESIGLRRRLVHLDPARWPDLAAAFVAFAWACLDSRNRLGEGLTAVIEACMYYHGRADATYRDVLREARELGVQLLESQGRGPEADRIRELIAPGREATDREVFAMVLNRDLGTAAQALNAMDRERAVGLVLLCGPMAAHGLGSEGLDEEILEAARRRDPVGFTELARLIRRRR